MAENTQNVIELRDVCKSYSSNDFAIDNINLTVKNGEFLTFLGPSGCGKSTLLRIISGINKPTSGKVFIDGVDVTNLPPEERHVNMIFQNYALFPHMTVFENVAFGLKCKKVPKAEIEKRVFEALNSVRLSKFANRKPASLSGGQQQRVAIARAIVNEPVVLLLDEPLSALDHNMRQKMQLELKQLQKRLGITFIFVTHDQSEALSLSDRIVVMNDGAIEQIGTPRDIYEEPANLFVAKFIGQTSIFDVTVLSVEGGYITAEVEGRIFKLKNKKNLQLGEKFHIVIRPEDIEVWGQSEVEKAELPEVMPGVVEQIIYKGSTVDLIVRLASGKTVLASQFFNEDDETLEYGIGEHVWVDWILGWEVILPCYTKEDKNEII